ncbi:MAG: sulfurtransferase [Ignavibacteriae bacterium]|nr:sulfurtransferase [Ignavibacteriota bacterium]
MPIVSRRRFVVGNAIVFLLTLVAVSAFAGQTPKARTSMLVTADWLSQHINDPSLIVLHVGDKAGFDEGHIPGAQYIQTSDLSTPKGEGLTLEMPPLDDLKATLERFGISDNSTIMVYFGKDWVSPTARVLLTLDYVGLGDRASMLDGGMPAWIAAGGTLSKDGRTPTPGSLHLHPNTDIVVKYDWVRSHLADERVAIVDSRTPEFYSGNKPGMMPRAGHIPGAISIPFNSLGDSLNRVSDAASLRKIFDDAGISSDKTVVTYCHIGQQASFGYFIAKYVGYDVRLYDGSFEEWSRNPELPVVNPSEQPTKE